MNMDEVILKIIYLKEVEVKGGKIIMKMNTAELIQKKLYLIVTKVWNLETTQNSEGQLQGTI